LAYPLGIPATSCSRCARLFTQLKKRAAAIGAGLRQLEEVDDAGSPKEAALTLVMELLAMEELALLKPPPGDLAAELYVAIGVTNSRGPRGPVGPLGLLEYPLDPLQIGKVS
jgi:hypothetical protein